MQTQLTCPQCRTPFATSVIQVIDVDQYPQLKEMLLAGQLNVAQCPACGWAGQVGTPLVYHDSAHELFMVFLPPELGLGHLEEQQLIGRLTRAVVENTPQEKRKGYLLQPPMQMMRTQPTTVPGMMLMQAEWLQPGVAPGLGVMRTAFGVHRWCKIASARDVATNDITAPTASMTLPRKMCR